MCHIGGDSYVWVLVLELGLMILAKVRLKVIVRVLSWDLELCFRIKI